MLVSLIGVSSAHAAGTAQPLKVMTRNLDAGTDFGLIFDSTLDFYTATTATWQEVQQSKIPERMAGIAAEIAAAQPDVVSLQEVTKYRTEPISHFTGAPTASKVVYDQLDSLMSALTADHAHYAVLKSLDELDVEVPTTLGIAVRMTDRDAMLVRTDEPSTALNVDNVKAAHYTNIAYAFGGSVPVYHGWISADITSFGHTVRVINTHLEANDSTVATKQAGELLCGTGGTSLPVIAAGDFNTGPGVSPTYAALLAGMPETPRCSGPLTDTWNPPDPMDLGNTWPLHYEDQYPLVFPPTSATPGIRIDLVLERGATPLTDTLVGNNPQSDLTPSGLWPSDHVGVVGTLGLS